MHYVTHATLLTYVLTLGLQTISFTRNGADWSEPNDGARFVIFSVGSVLPTSAPATQLQNLTIVLSGFDRTTAADVGLAVIGAMGMVRCRFKSADDGGVLGADDVGAGVAGTYLPRSAPTETSPGNSECAACQCCVTCSVPADIAPQTVHVEVSTDSGSDGSFSTDGIELRLYPQPTIASVAHPYGPVTGGAEFRLNGSDFADAHASTALVCQFVSTDR